MPNIPLPTIPAPQGQPPAQPARGGQAGPANTTEAQKKRRWSVWAQGVLGLQSRRGQNGILASAVATAARIDEATLQPGQGPNCAAALSADNTLMADQVFAAFVAELRKYEALPLPREASQSGALLHAAQTAKAAANGAPAKAAACDEVLSALKAQALRDEIIGFGMPPWTGETAPGSNKSKASRATAAKVELDLLSIPPQQRTLEKLPTDSGVNASFWIKRTGADPAVATPRSFLCKPAQAPDDDDEQAVPGIPNGGEVVREALTGHLAGILSQTMTLDLEMPETHVVSLPASYFPSPPAGGNDMTCSVQEFRTNRGSVLDATPGVLARVPASQCAALTILDMVSLNTDRHSGNLLIGDDGRLVPIDHGCAFPQNTERGRERLRDGISTPRNALLSLPGSHQPMTEEMASGLRAMNPLEIGRSLLEKAGEIGTEHPDMDGLIDQPSIVLAVKSAHFLRLAGSIKSGKRRLSPAAVQIAFSANCKELLGLAFSNNDTKAFDRRATEILKQALLDQPITEQASLVGDSAYLMLQAKLDALGWTMQMRNGPPNSGVANDPALCMKLLAGKVRCPQGADGRSLDAARAAAKGVKVRPAAISTAIVDAEMETLNQMAGLLPGQDAGQMTAWLDRNGTALRADAATRRNLTHEMTVKVLATQNAELQAVRQQYAVGAGATSFLERALDRKDWLDAKTKLEVLRTEIARGNYPARQQPAAPQPAPAQQGGSNG